MKKIFVVAVGLILSGCVGVPIQVRQEETNRNFAKKLGAIELICLRSNFSVADNFCIGKIGNSSVKIVGTRDDAGYVEILH